MLAFTQSLRQGVDASESAAEQQAGGSAINDLFVTTLGFDENVLVKAGAHSITGVDSARVDPRLIDLMIREAEESEKKQRK